MNEPPLRVLIVDDQAGVVTALQVLLDIHGISHVAASTPSQALKIASTETLGAVIQDMNFTPNETSGREGVDLFRALRRADPSLPILLVTAWASLEAAVELVKDGASDYLRKPWDDDAIINRLRDLLKMRQLEAENRRLRAATEKSQQILADENDLCGVVYASHEMHEIVSLAVNIARSDAPVLITGPSGSGKERLAEIIQANSHRKEEIFMRVNVGAIPVDLMESELFGAESGAFTGASSRRIGHFESADKGTLFLDEVDALSLSGQVKLLRVLQSGEFRRLGSSSSRRADVRIISATNSNLEEAINDKRFREDLYYRLNVVELKIMALHERLDDILPLARFFLDAFKAGAKYLSPAAEQALLDHPWPGNVRELENRIQRATVVSSRPEIDVEDLGFDSGQNSHAPKDRNEELQPVIDALDSSDGVVAHAAEVLGISRQALYRKMNKLGIEVERKARPERPQR
ncbi:MAG: sigma-54 dependent transcriptional regulator [Thermoanaerobaculales bacterium]|nr:sigma-54 dependent transcriptional regulator [Thermoanaerobaculales bacterium]